MFNGEYAISTDNGETWNEHSLTSQILIYLLDTDRTGTWVICINGETLSVSSITDIIINSIATDCKGTWIMCGNNGNYAISTDNGETWSANSLTITSTLYSIAIDCKGTWIMCGSGEKHTKSTDNGETWKDTFNCIISER